MTYLWTKDGLFSFIYPPNTINSFNGITFNLIFRKIESCKIPNSINQSKFYGCSSHSPRFQFSKICKSRWLTLQPFAAKKSQQISIIFLCFAIHFIRLLVSFRSAWQDINWLTRQIHKNRFELCSLAVIFGLLICTTRNRNKKSFTFPFHIFFNWILDLLVLTWEFFLQTMVAFPIFF